MGEDASKSASATLTRIEKGCYQYAVINYTQRWKTLDSDKEERLRCFKSDNFEVGGYLWSLSVYPAGHSIDAFNSGCTSIYIYVESDLQSTLVCVFDLYILDQSGKGKDLGVNLFGGNFPCGKVARFKRRHQFAGFEFVKRKDLESPDYLGKDDGLRIRTTIGIVRSCQFEKLPVFKVPQQSIGADFSRLLGSKKGTDVLFMVSGERFCAHRCVLTARSPAFLRGRFSDAHPHDKQVIKITDVEPGVFKAMLQFIYTGNFSEEQQQVDSSFHPSMPEPFMVKMLAAAHRFELKRLKKICELHILKKVSTESVVYFLHLAFVYDAAELKALCLRFLAENEVDIVGSHGSEYLRESCPSLFLDLMGYKENAYTKVEGEHGLIGKVLYAVKGSVFGMLEPPYARMKHIKDL